MKRILIGSVAAHHWFPDFRESKDTDYLCLDSDNHINFKGDGEIERVEWYNADRNPGLRLIYDSFPNKDKEYVATPTQLYTLKVSHALWPIRWPKTMKDIEFFQNAGVTLDEELFSLLYKGWEKIHGQKRAMLDKSNEEFFTDAVDRKYNHDDIHRIIAYYDRPLFEECKKDSAKALLSQELFERLSNTDKIRLCREELYVTALERHLIPTNFKMPPLMAYRKAAEKLVTSMSKGWFPKYIVLHWNELNKLDDHPFVELFRDAQVALLR